ncbi:hypothetical protein Tco_1314810 [Tanacetum coccineum]
MPTLKFVDSHNMVVFLTKSAKSEGFEQIATVKVKTVNGEVQLQALVDGKKISITEATVRRDLQPEDIEGIDCLPNATIFEQLTLMGYEKLSQKLTFYKAFFSLQWKFLIHTILQCLSAKTTAWNEFSSIMASAIICEGSAMPTDPHHTPIITQPSSFQPQRKQKSRRPKEKDTEIPQSSVPSDPTNVADEAVNKEPSMKLKGLMEFCTKLQQRVLDLENTKTAQAQEITSFKLRVKRLEKKGRSRTHKLKILYKVGRSVRVVSSNEASFGDQEDASKQGRKIDDINKDADITLVDETQGRHDDDLMFDTGVLNYGEVFVGQDMSEKEVSTADPVTTAGEVVTTASVEVSTASSTEATIADELTLAQTLIEIKKERSNQADEELAFRLQVEEEEEEARLAREKAEKEQEANVALIEEWNDIQAEIEADQLLAERLQAREQEELTIEERAKLFQQLLEKRRKHFAAKRAEEMRNIPPTTT